MTGWDTEDPPSYDQAAFISDAGLITDDTQYAKHERQSMLERAKAVKLRNDAAAAEALMTENAEDSGDREMIDVDLLGNEVPAEAQGEGKRAEHLEFAQE